MGKLAAVGWIVALLVAGISYLGYEFLLEERQTALEAQAAEYESRIAKVKADAEKTVQKVRDEAAANEMVMQTELDIAKMPELPLKFEMRRNQVLYVENQSNEEFSCPIKLTRPKTGATSEKLFTIPKQAFRDLAAIDQWVFETGDVIEFNKPGYKSWRGEIP